MNTENEDLVWRGTLLRLDASEWMGYRFDDLGVIDIPERVPLVLCNKDGMITDNIVGYVKVDNIGDRLAVECHVTAHKDIFDKLDHIVIGGRYTNVKADYDECLYSDNNAPITAKVVKCRLGAVLVLDEGQGIHPDYIAKLEEGTDD